MFPPPTLRIARLLRRHAASFERLARRTHDTMQADPVHDLRVLTRRIRAAAWIGRHLAPEGGWKELRRLLRKVGRALGERRLLDVALSDAAARKLDATPVMERHRRAGEAVRRQLRPSKRARLVRLLKEAAAAVESVPSPAPLGEALQARAERLREAAEEAARRGSGETARSKAALHRLRIEAKKTRYILEALERDAEYLKELQTRIGAAHDLQVLQELVARHPAVAREEARAWAAARASVTRRIHRAVRELRREDRRTS